MEQWSTKVYWRFASMELGEQCAMGHLQIRILTTGVMMKQELYVASLDIKNMVCSYGLLSLEAINN